MSGIDMDVLTRCVPMPESLIGGTKAIYWVASIDNVQLDLHIRPQRVRQVSWSSSRLSSFQLTWQDTPEARSTVHRCGLQGCGIRHPVSHTLHEKEQGAGW